MIFDWMVSRLSPKESPTPSADRIEFDIQYQEYLWDAKKRLHEIERREKMARNAEAARQSVDAVEKRRQLYAASRKKQKGQGQ